MSRNFGEQLSPEEVRKLLELDLADMTTAVNDLVDIIRLNEEVDKTVRVTSLVKALWMKAPMRAHAIFAAIAIDLLASDRSQHP